MNKSFFKNGLIMIAIGFVANLLGRWVAISGLFSGKGNFFSAGLLLAALSPILIVVGILLSIYGYLSNPKIGYTERVNPSTLDGSKSFCHYCGKIINKNEKYCRYCGKEQF